MRRFLMGTWESLALRLAPLFRADANTIEQYNGTSNQVFRLYATRASQTDYEALKTYFDSGNGAFRLEAEKGGSGGSFRRIFVVVSGNIWQFNSTSFVPPSTLTANLGDSGNYFNQIFGFDYIASTTGKFRWAGSTRVTAPANGVLRLTNDNENTGSGTIAFDSRQPSTITTDQNNYDVSVPGYFLRLVSNTAVNLTGLTFSAITKQDGQVHLIVNAGSNNITLKHQDTNSTAANRFLNSTGADIVLAGDQAAEMIYDSTTSRWRVFKRN